MKRNYVVFGTLLIVLWATVVNLSIGNFGLSVQTRDILVDPIMDSENKYIGALKKALKADVILSNDTGFRIKTEKVTLEFLRFLLKFSERLKNVYWDAGVEINVGGLMSIDEYALEPVGKFLSKSRIESDGFDTQKWLAHVEQKPYGKMFFSRKTEGAFSFKLYTMPTDQDVSGLRLFFIAQKIKFGWEMKRIHMYFGDMMKWVGLLPEADLDFPEGVSVATFGWTDWRMLINKVSFSFIFSVLVAGSLLPATPVWFALRSVKQVALCFLCNVLVLWVMRGLIISIVDFVTPWSFHEETYTILAYIPVMMLNYSFSLRLFKDFNAVWHENPDGDRKRIWQKVLAGKPLKISKRFVVLVAAVDFIVFMCLPHIDGSRSIINVGILATLSILLLTYPTVRFALPAFHEILGGIGKQPKKLEDSRWSRFVLSFVSWKYARAVSGGTIILLIATSFFCYQQKMLIQDSIPGDFIKSVKEGQIMTELEGSDDLGSGIVKIFSQGDLNDPDFVEKQARYAFAVRDKKQARALMTPTDFLFDILSVDFPSICRVYKDCLTTKNIEQMAELDGMTTEEFLDDKWQMIAENPVTNHIFALSDGSILIPATNVASRTSDMREFRDNLERVGKEINAEAANRFAQYPESDEAVTKGSLQNYLGSPVLIALVSMILFGLVKVRQSAYNLGFFHAGLLTAIPFAFSTSLTLLIMMMLKIPLDVATAAIGNITVSAAADLPTFLLVRLRNEASDTGLSFEKLVQTDAMADEVSRAGTDVLVNALTYIPLTIPFLTVFPPIRDLGLMLIVALGGCYAGTMLMLPFAKKS